MIANLANAKSTTAANTDPLAWTFGNQYLDSEEEINSQDGAPKGDIVQALKPDQNLGHTR